MHKHIGGCLIADSVQIAQFTEAKLGILNIATTDYYSLLFKWVRIVCKTNRSPCQEGPHNNLWGTKSEKIGSDLLKVINNVNIKTCRRTKRFYLLKKIIICPTIIILFQV